jgi:hypothetical protein
MYDKQIKVGSVYSIYYQNKGICVKILEILDNDILCCNVMNDMDKLYIDHGVFEANNLIINNKDDSMKTYDINIKHTINKIKEIETLVDLSIGKTLTDEVATDIFQITNDLITEAKYQVIFRTELETFVEWYLDACVDTSSIKSIVDGYLNNK